VGEFEAGEPSLACMDRTIGVRSSWSGWCVLRSALGRAGLAGQLFGTNDVGVARVGWQRLWPHASASVAFADLNLPHHKSLLLGAGGCGLAPCASEDLAYAGSPLLSFRRPLATATGGDGRPPA
jgi:hypothetical protein